MYFSTLVEWHVLNEIYFVLFPFIYSFSTSLPLCSFFVAILELSWVTSTEPQSRTTVVVYTWAITGCLIELLNAGWPTSSFLLMPQLHMRQGAASLLSGMGGPPPVIMLTMLSHSNARSDSVFCGLCLASKLFRTHTSSFST